MRSKKNQFLENSWNASAIIQFRNRFRYPFENKYQTSEIRLNVTFICIVEFWRMIFYSYNISQLRPINVMSKYCVSGIKILDICFFLPSIVLCVKNSFGVHFIYGHIFSKIMEYFMQITKDQIRSKQNEIYRHSQATRWNTNIFAVLCLLAM